MTIPEQLQPHWALVLDAEREFSVPAARLGGTIMIESNGDPRAVQRNTSNGYSYGLTQVVPYTANPQRQGWEGHHARVKRLAGLPTNAPPEQVVDALYDPRTNIRVGASLLRALYDQHGSWDRASSAFFLGNPDWRGADTVNGNTGPQYRAMLADWMETIEDTSGDDDVTDPTTPKMVRFAGSSVDVPLDVPFRIALLPTWQTRQRPGILMDPDRYIQHETGNPNPGANAEMHRQYLVNGAEGQQLGYHLTVDKDECIQMIPLNEVAWHGGDGSGVCNYGGIACELTVEDNNRHKVPARSNAEKVAAAVMQAMSLTILEQHNVCWGKDCPHYIRKDGYWPTFVANVNARRAGITPAPAPTYAKPLAPPLFDGEDKDLGTATFLACRREYTVVQDGLKRHQYADPTSKVVGPPLVKGEEFIANYIVVGSDGKPWVITPYGTRIQMAGLSPQVTIA